MIKTLSAVLIEPKKPLEIEELIIPDPSPEQVVVEQIASGICLSQVHEIDKTPLGQCPRIIGHEGVGIATHVGSSVKSIKEGKLSIKESYAVSRRGEIFIINSYSIKFMQLSFKSV